MFVAISAQLKTIPKTGDVTHAFVQSVLPEDEKYDIKPPKGCSLKPSKIFMLLKKILYGLKRSPYHWYENCRTTLINISLQPLPNTPCIFTGSLIPDEPPICLGLYVNDFIYLSESNQVEALLEREFGEALKIAFDPQISNFLGVKFTNTIHDDGNVEIFMTQQADVNNLVKRVRLDKTDSLTAKTP